MKKTIALINPFSSSEYLSAELKRNEIYTVALFTQPKYKLPSYVVSQDNLFDKQIYLDTPKLCDVKKTLSTFDIDYIINGNESSTHLTDLLNMNLLPSLANDPSSSPLRSNKYAAQEALKDSGFPYIQQQRIFINDLDRSTLDKITFPCYCKPVHGMASIGAFKALNSDELINQINEIKDKVSLFDTSEYLVQEYVVGEEFVVDTFSYKGNHFISSVQKYKKELINNVFLYRYIEIVHEQELWDRCKSFIKDCLDIIHFKNGFAHSEIFITPQKKIKLIEINPRISGAKGYHNKLAKVEHLKSQVDLLLEALHCKPIESSLKNRIGHGRGLFLFNFYNHQLKDPSTTLSRFPTVIFYDLVNPIGFISQNNKKSLADLDLLIMLFSEDKQLLENDSSEIYALEKSGELL